MENQKITLRENNYLNLQISSTALHNIDGVNIKFEENIRLSEINSHPIIITIKSQRQSESKSDRN
jgi:hypothetical protein